MYPYGFRAQAGEPIEGAPRTVVVEVETPDEEWNDNDYDIDEMDNPEGAANKMRILRELEDDPDDENDYPYLVPGANRANQLWHYRPEQRLDEDDLTINKALTGK
jgi:hypothetical protein